MSATYIGYDGQDLMPESSWSISQEGLVTYTEKIMVLRSVNAPTPTLAQTRSIGGSTLRAVSINTVSAGGAFTELTITYQGQQGATIQQDITSSTSEEPIESNPFFSVADSGGGSSIVTAAGPANVIYNTDNSFAGFSKDAKKNFFGVRSYLSPNLSYRRSFTTSDDALATDLSKVGRIVNAPENGDFPSAATGSTWLCVGISYVKRGRTYDITQEYRASDSKGWNEYIYGPSVNAPDGPY